MKNKAALAALVALIALSIFAIQHKLSTDAKENQIEKERQIQNAKVIAEINGEIDRKEQAKQLTIDFKHIPYQSQDDCWVPEVTVHNNAETTLRGIYFALTVYDEQKNLVWHGNMLIDSLNAASSYKEMALGSPPCIPNSVQSEVEVTDERYN